MQRHRGSGDDDPRFAQERQRDGGAGVGRRLAHAGTGLDDGDGLQWIGVFAQVAAGQRTGHQFGHFVLAQARTEPRRGADHLLKGLQGLGGEVVHGEGTGRLGSFCHEILM